MELLASRGVETREGFIPFNMQKIFIDAGIVRPDACPIANRVAGSGFYLPSGPGLKDAQVRRVAGRLKAALEGI